MRATGFTRTATRWRSFSGAVVTAWVAACMVSTTKFYLPASGQSRLSLDQLRTRAGALLTVECPRLLAGRPSAFGETDLTMDVDEQGSVLRAHVDRSSGDARIDDIFGALAAQLQLTLPSSSGSKSHGARQRIGIGYSCSATEAEATVQLNPK
jgi:outer membrane biosynthesis protein TonB